MAILHPATLQPIPPNTLAELQRDLARKQLVAGQIRQFEKARLEQLKQAPKAGPNLMVLLLMRVIGIGIETADMLVKELLSRNMRDRRAVARYGGLTGSVGRKNLMQHVKRPADKHDGDLRASVLQSSLNASMRRRCRWCSGRTLSNRTMRAPVVEIADILGQDLLEMALIEYEHVVQALGPDRSHPALGDCVGPRRSERRAGLGNTETTHPPIEAGAHSSCRGHERGSVAAGSPNCSIRRSVAPSTRRSDAMSRGRGELADWHDGLRRTRTVF
jgi:hypothetical protein